MSRLSDETLQHRERMLKGLTHRPPTKAALKWAAAVRLIHWHKAGFGCSPTCLDSISYLHDTERQTCKPWATPQQASRFSVIHSVASKRLKTVMAEMDKQSNGGDNI
jgi:hypothetical protein